MLRSARCELHERKPTRGELTPLTDQRLRDEVLDRSPKTRLHSAMIGHMFMRSQAWNSASALFAIGDHNPCGSHPGSNSRRIVMRSFLRYSGLWSLRQGHSPEYLKKLRITIRREF